MGKHKDLSDCDKGQFVMLDDRICSSPKQQVLWGVTGMQWSVPAKNGSRKDSQ